MPSELDICRSAKLFLELHADKAVENAREMARTMRERGDIDGADAWLRIIVAIETLQDQPISGRLQ